MITRKYKYPLLAATLAIAACAQAQYTDMQAYSDYGGGAEFATRRAELGRHCGSGLVVLFARTETPEAEHYREDNDFYYYTGISDPGAMLILDCADAAANNGRVMVFEPVQEPRTVQVYGPNVLALPTATLDAMGYTAPPKLTFTDLPTGKSLVYPLRYADVVLTRMLADPAKQTLWLRLGSADKADGARLEPAMDYARAYSSSYGATMPAYLQRIQLLRERYPAATVKDITPIVDPQRNIKRPSEVAIFRRVGKLSAEGNAYAISRAHPGSMQYDIEADATWYYMRHGAQLLAYPAIVGSGTDANTWHYFSDRHRINDGDVVVFDYAASLDGITMDITRTFPINGRFTAEEARWYAADLEAQQASIALLTPGHTYEEAGAAGEAVYRKYGIADQWLGFPGHFVGLATHDVMHPEGPVKPGQVVTVEPIIEFPDKHWHFRIEDTILITDGPPEILSGAIPKDRDSMEKLPGSARQ